MKCKNHSILLRFDCDLSLELHDPEMKAHSNMYNIKPDHYYKFGLSERNGNGLKRLPKI